MKWGTTVGGSRAAAVNRPNWSFGPVLGGFGPRDLSQTPGNGRRIHLGGFLRPGDHSGPISGHFPDFGPDPLSETSTSVLSQQQTSVLSQQQTSVLSQQQTSVLSQQKTSILSQQKTSLRSKPKTSNLVRNGSRIDRLA